MRREPIQYDNINYLKFQSTHPRGVRPSSFKVSLNLFLFQSTHPRGVRQRCDSSLALLNVISIHALTGSATNSKTNTIRQNTNFNPRTHGECDKSYDDKGSICTYISIHALTGSATDWERWEIVLKKISIHALTGSATSVFSSIE